MRAGIKPPPPMAMIKLGLKSERIRGAAFWHSLCTYDGMRCQNMHDIWEATWALSCDKPGCIHDYRSPAVY